MRRKDREIKDIKELEEMLKRSKVVRIGMSVHDQPYVIPANFGYERLENGWALYIHSAREGKKIDILKTNNRVCVEMDGEHQLIERPNAAGCTYAYESLIGEGHAYLLESAEDKLHGLKLLMEHQTEKPFHGELPAKAVEETAVYKIVLHSLTGKRNQTRPGQSSI